MTTTPTAPVKVPPAYPVLKPESGNDKRFTLGLMIDITAVLQAHGYPPLRSGEDYVRFQQALFTAIYEERK